MAANSDKAAKEKAPYGVFPWPLRVAPPAASECRPHCGKLQPERWKRHRDSVLDAMPPQMAKKCPARKTPMVAQSVFALVRMVPFCQ
jgi:hypothetical protein